jgi:DNA polymerase III alpha subunit
MDCMRTNVLKQVIATEDDMVEVLYRGEAVNGLIVDDPIWITQFNRHCKLFELPLVADWAEESNTAPEQFVQDNLSEWYLPTEYADFDLESYLLSKCRNSKQTDRVQLELVEYGKRDMIKVLIWMKYFVDTLRNNNQVWGAGRGSSVASYILFLMDVHRVDSLEFELDIKEFLK